MIQCYYHMEYQMHSDMYKNKDNQMFLLDRQLKNKHVVFD